MRLILASTSPRRREILALLGLPFEVIAPDFTEAVSSHLSIEDEVLEFAMGKARSVAIHHSEAIVIGSDTMIFLDGANILLWVVAANQRLRGSRPRWRR